MIQIKINIKRLSRRQRFSGFKAITMGQIQHSIGNPCGSPIGMNMVQPHGNLCCRRIGLKPQVYFRGTDNISVSGKRR